MANLPPDAPPPGGYGAPPPGGYGLGDNPYAPPAAGFAPGAIQGECPQAATALKYAIIGFFCFGVVLGPLAIKNALDAKRIIAMNPGMGGEGKATAALVIGVIDVVFFIIGVVFRLSNA
jgi:hypothetical protein